MAEEGASRERGMGRRKRVHRPTRGQRQDEVSEPQETSAAEERTDAGEEPAAEGAEPEAAEQPAAEQEPAAQEERASDPEPAPVGVAQIARIARAQLQELIGRPVTAVLGVEGRDGNWEVEVETVELQRVPETTNIMGLYRVTLDEEGEIMEFRRIRRYRRAEPDEDR
jgi:hypothetical protein